MSIYFFVGDIVLGTTKTGNKFVTPLDLVQGGTVDTTAVINIARFLQSLDSALDDVGITIPSDLSNVAVVSNDELTSSIESLDFADETAFVNAASHLIAVLIESYPHTATLIDADTARAHLIEQLNQLE